MKKLFAILMSLMVLTFTQCKPDGNQDDNNETVKVRCEVPINGVKSDFSNLIEDGSIKWSIGTERIYLAIPNDLNPVIVELTAITKKQATVLIFEGEVSTGMIKENTEYDIWYFGNSKNSSLPYVTEVKSGDYIKSIEGSIANQSGNLSDLGYCHIAKTTVTAKMEDDEIVLPLSGNLSNVVAIAYLDLKDINKLYGNAIKGTKYKLQYNSGKYEFGVIEDDAAFINVTDGKEESFIALLPNESDNVVLLKDNNSGCNFKKGIQSNEFYCRKISDVEIGPLKWGNIANVHNGYQYVDMGLPSGTKWAKYNIGATTPEGYGNYYAWGETETKTSYHAANCKTWQKEMSSISGNLEYDAATANWGGSWRMPTAMEIGELMDKKYCTWTWTTQNGVNGYLVTSKINNNSIFMPASGYKSNSTISSLGTNCYYWGGTVGSNNEQAYRIYFDVNTVQNQSYGNRHFGHVIRPVWK